MTEFLLKKVEKKIDKKDEDQVGWFNFLKVSFYFGLRPKEMMDVVESPVVEDHNGIPILIGNQTKLTSSNEEGRIKKIPVVCEEQMEALGVLQSKKIKRPLPSWVDGICKDKGLTYGINEDYGLYTGRKGFTNHMLTLGQSLEDISAWLGHHSIDLTWRVYRTKNVINFSETDFVAKNFKKPKAKPKKIS